MIKRQKAALAEELSSDMSSHLFRATNQIQIHESMIRFFSTAKKGQKIPSELKLAEHYHVSRATIREVLQKLEFEGYLIRKKGSGTYLLNPPVNEKENLLYFFDIQSMIRAKGFLPILRSRNDHPSTRRRLLCTNLGDPGTGGDYPAVSAVPSRRALYSFTGRLFSI